VERLDVERPLAAGNVHVVRLQHADAEEMVESLSGALEALAQSAGESRAAPIQVTAQSSTNSLIITASAQDYAIIADIIAKLDIPREQVLVEMTIMEASQEAVEELGIEWASVTPPGRHLRGFGDTDFGLRVEELTGTLEGLSVGAFELGSAGETRIAAILHALERDARVNILSKPHVLTSNNQEARITVAQNVPFVRQTRITETDPATPTAIRTFTYEDVGIEMTITPHLSAGGQVRLEIASSFTQIVESATGLGPETPTTAKREAQTTVSVVSGSTVVIGGLMRDDLIASERKVPLLGDVPLVGALFRRTRETTQKTNLLLFITPHVLTLPEDLADMSARKQVEAGMEQGAPRLRPYR
jgi:general secretion pathway protein D